MIGIKVTGVILLLCSVGIFSLSGKHRDRERLRRIEAQLEFVRFVRDRIDRFLAPVSEILREANCEMMRNVTIGCESEFADIDGLRALLRDGEYYVDGGEIFDRFLASLGSSYREGELVGCDICIKDLGAVRERLARDLPRDRKSRTVLSFCFVSAIAIFLI